jgi:DNA mismatch repair protein MutS
MDYLLTDDQTINDLAILEKSGKASVFSLFNKARTQGGRSRMERLFKEPIADEGAINERTSLYKFFSKHNEKFSIDPNVIGSVAYYLENEDVRSQLQGGQSFGQRFNQMVAADADLVFVQDGVNACLRLFFQTKALLRKLEEIIKGSPYEPAWQELSRVVESQAFTGITPYISDRYEVKISHHVLADIDKQLRFENRDSLKTLLELLYDLDVCMAVGDVARTKGFCFGRAFPKNYNQFSLSQVYHPHVEGAIANDLRLNEENNILFLTGANMAGKSTLMKSIGIALYLGHMGFPVAAKDFEFAVRDGLFTSINLSDNLSQGASHYYAEVLRVKEVALSLQSGKKLFVIFDELFRGTNVKDAHDATIAITKAFTFKTGSQFIISTHIMEAGEILDKEVSHIKYQFLPTEMKGSIPTYPRVLKNGITSDRQGMIIIQNEGVLELLENGLVNLKKDHHVVHH